MENNVLIIDFGSQYTQLIARRVRELNIYSEIHPFNKIPSNLNRFKAIILSGSPFSVRDKNAPKIDLDTLINTKPVLAVCYGAQLLANEKGGLVLASNIREYGRANLSFVDAENELMKGVLSDSQVWMSHGDTIASIPENYKVIASTHDVKVAAYEIEGEHTYALQFHPEVNLYLHLRWLFFVLLYKPRKFFIPGSQNIFYQLYLRFKHNKSVSVWLDHFLDNFLLKNY